MILKNFWSIREIHCQGGTPPPIHWCCLMWIFSELTRTILKPLDFLKRKKLVLVSKKFLRGFPLTISVVRLILWSAHGENQDLRTAVARCSWGWLRVRNSIPESSESSVSSSLVLWVQIHVDIPLWRLRDNQIDDSKPLVETDQSFGNMQLSTAHFSVSKCWQGRRK